MSYRNEFHKKFYKNCMPVLAKFEDERKKKFSAFKVRAFLGCILYIFLFFCITFNSNIIPKKYERDFKKLILGIIYVAIIGDYYKTKKDFEKKIKFKLMPVFCSALGDFSWCPTKIVDYNLFVNAGVVPQNWHIAESDDIFTGKHNDVTIEIAEVRYYKKQFKMHETTFHGVVILLDMNKKFQSHTLVTADNARHISPINGLRHTTLEDSTFEKIFDVFTNDEIEARYLLTPSFMERLLKVKNVFKSAKVSCAFYMNKLFISLYTGDMFSLGAIEVPADDYKQFFIMFEEITSIIELIDHFKLDQKIGL